MEAATLARRRRRYLLEERRFLAPALIAPAVLVVAVIVGVPLGWAIYLSLTDAIGGELGGNWVGFDNFVDVWRDENFRRAFRNTLLFTFGANAIVLVGAAILSNFLAKDFWGKWFVRFLIVLPWAAPISVAVLGWLWILDSLFSVVNWTLSEDLIPGSTQLDLSQIFTLGFGDIDRLDPPQWLGRPNLALISVTLVHAWRILPFAVIIFLAGRASIPNEVEDAAKIDGATGLKKLWYVDLPLQLPIALVALLFGIVFTAGDMAVVKVLTNGGPFNSTQMLTTWAFATGIESSSLGQGAAIALYLLPLLVLVSVLMLFFARRAQVS